MGSGDDLPIADLARMVISAVGFSGVLTHDTTKPDGTPRKLMAADKLRALGWRPSITLADGIAATYQHWLAHGGANDRRMAV